MTTLGTLKDSALKDKIPWSRDIEISYNGEADLYKHYSSCRKRRNHDKFIPVNNFNISHLHGDYQAMDIVEFIKLVAQLTVRLTVRYVSPERPATVPGTQLPYPGYEHRGACFMTVGTGLITDVNVGFDWLNKLTMFKLEVTTAAHVVFDHLEAQNTTCHLFFDDGDQLDDCLSVLEFNTVSVFVVNALTDECALHVHIPDSNMAHVLTRKLYRLTQLKNSIRDKLKKMSDPREDNPLTFIVSHPHGSSKKISLGRCVEVDDNLDDVRLVYTTPTCPGSSGAAVICLDKKSLFYNFIHTGQWKDSRFLNLGSCRYRYALHLADRQFRSQFGILDRYHDEDFRLEGPTSSWPSLPAEYRYNLVVDYMKAFSQLCVRLAVDYVSENRPQFWPGGETPYPWYEKKRSSERRSGSGWVHRVETFPNKSFPGETCKCWRCCNSITPEKKFACVFVLTSTSLVFDQSEGRRARCWTNTGHMSQPRPSLSSSFGAHDVYGDVDTDRSKLVFITHDLALAERLKFILDYVSLLKDKVPEKVSSKRSEYPICILADGYGTIKVGRCLKVGQHLVYTTPTGPESVGAAVVVLGDKHVQCDVSGHTGLYPQDLSLGYSRSFHYQYK